MGKTKTRAMPEGKKFVKGKSGNPAGRPKLPAAVKAVRAMNADQIAEMGTILLESNINELKYIVSDPNVSIIKKWTATIILKSMASGDEKAWQGVLNRVVGRVDKRILFEEERKTPIQQKIESMSSEQRIEYVLDAAKDLKDILDAE